MIPRYIGSMVRTSDKDGIVFYIQRYSIHDGPGIRTLVFFKGCPLRCLWCSNPEGQKAHPELMWIEHNCIHCRKCEVLCPEGALSETENGQKVLKRELCTLCGICDENCYAGAIQLVGRYVSVEEVLKEVEKDRRFYEKSGGGITLGGGDPLAQPKFALKLLKENKKRGLNTVVETAGYAPWRILEGLVDYVDLFLYDIKIMNPQKHQEYTGVSNELILKNAQRLSALGDPMLIRVPIIPGYNDDEANIKVTARFAMGLKSSPGVELLPYFKLGTSKYRRLGREYPLAEVQPPSELDMERLRGWFVQLNPEGLPC